MVGWQWERHGLQFIHKCFCLASMGTYNCFLQTASCSPLSPSLYTVSIHKASQGSYLASQSRLNGHKSQEKMCNCPISAILLQATLWIKAWDYSSFLWQLLRRFSLFFFVFYKDPLLSCTHSKQLKTQSSNCNKVSFFSAFANSRGYLDFLFLFLPFMMSPLSVMRAHLRAIQR